MIINAPKDCHKSALRQLWKEAFGDDDAFLDGFFEAGYEENRCRCLWQEETLCAALYWFDCSWQGKKIAYLYAVATGKQSRGKGLCRALMDATHAHLKAQGYAGAILVPGSGDLFTFYEKLGYTHCCGVTRQEISAAGQSVSLTQIAPEEYALLQKKFLPADGVFHSPEALAFAATYASFYQGEGFAFCGGSEADTFYFQEYLGDTTRLPGILTALKKEKGRVCTPGEDPLAMYYPLEESTLPSYFAIPLN